MKHVIALLLGLIVGMILFSLVLIYNPFIADRGLSPLSVTDARIISLNYSVVPAESIVYTNDGESMHLPCEQREMLADTNARYGRRDRPELTIGCAPFPGSGPQQRNGLVLVHHVEIDDDKPRHRHDLTRCHDRAA